MDLEAVTGPIGNGLQGITDINPFAGVLVGVLIAAIIWLAKERGDEKKRADAAEAKVEELKDKQLEEALSDKALFERLVDRLEKRRST